MHFGLDKFYKSWHPDVTFSPQEKVLLITKKCESIRRLLSATIPDYASHLEAEVKKEHVINVIIKETHEIRQHQKQTIY